MWSAARGERVSVATLRLDESDYRREWANSDHNGKPRPVVCDHPHPDATICPECMGDFVAVLVDVPDLLHHLELAQTKQVVFVERGQPQEDTGESPIEWNPAASEAALDLWKCLNGLAWVAVPVEKGWGDTPWQVIFNHRHRLSKRDDFPQMVARISSAAAKAMRVIDSPPQMYHYGPCPLCGVDIWQERVHERDTQTPIRCQQDDCDYAQFLAEHLRTQLDIGDNRMLTVNELVSAITSAGEVVTRDQINGWIRREGLPRETQNVPKWINKTLTPVEVHVYRVGDVRRLARLAERRKRGLS